LPSAPCGIAEFVASAQRLDPLHRRGVPLDPELLDLAFRLLRWEPAERLSAAEALRHPAMQVGLYKIVFHLFWWVQESIIPLLPPPICITHTTAILLHDVCAI